jgi:hypothetical protein
MPADSQEEASKHTSPRSYGVEVGRDPISRVTDATMDDARARQSRPPENIYYPVVS